eukprot:194662_1
MGVDANGDSISKGSVECDETDMPHHYTYNSIQYDAERVHRIQFMRMRLLIIKEIETIYLVRISLDAAKYHLKQKQLVQKQYEEGMDLNQHIHIVMPNTLIVRSKSPDTMTEFVRYFVMNYCRAKRGELDHPRSLKLDHHTN